MSRFRILAAAVVAFSVFAGALPAAADPSSTPPAASIVAVAAQTLTPLCDQFSTDYDATSPTFPLYCFDAVGTTPITTKNNAACADITRPNGAAADISAVADSPSFTSGGTTYKCMDLAFVDRPLNSTDPTNLGQDTIAEDLISYSYLPTGNLPSNLSLVDLEAIFSCNASLISSSDIGPVTENEIGGKGTDAVMPVIPSAASGTRSDWMSDLGLSDSTTASCVTNGSYTYDGTAYPIEENEGTNPVFDSTDNTSAADVIFPYSGGDYVCYNDTKACQATQFGNEFDSGSLVLGDIARTAPLTGTAPDQTINVAGFDSTFDRGLFADFVSTGTSPYIPAYLRPLLGTGTRGTGWICTKTSPATGQADIVEYGFVNVASCGSITLTPQD